MIRSACDRISLSDRMNKDIAIQVKNVGKTFRIPHEKVDSLRGAFVGALKGKRTFEEFKALDDVSFEVKKGEFFGIIGRNGSGKSTLLKVLAGIYEADKGAVKIDGMISPFLELGIGFNPELSGRDNVYLNATVLGMTQKQIDEKFDAIVAFSELERFIDQKLKNYSSGMQVRLAFSVSIHANRDILLMDEVLAVGDSNFQAKCIREFLKYKETGRTVILVSHDTDTIQRYCNRAMLLQDGKVIRAGKPADVVGEYIQRNISEEELRLSPDKVSERSAPNGKRVAEILHAEFLDGDEKKKQVFKTGEDMFVRIHFRLNEEVKDLNFGLGIYSQEDVYFSGFSTIRDRVTTDMARKRGYYQVKLKNIPFNEGFYYLKINIAGIDFADYYDYVGHSKETFRVFSDKKNPGSISMNYSWE